MRDPPLRASLLLESRTFGIGTDYARIIAVGVAKSRWGRQECACGALAALFGSGLLLYVAQLH
jgi:hypothetical protein